MKRIVQTERRIRASDGCSLSALTLDTEDASEFAPVILIFPAMAAPARAYRKMGRFFTARGYRVILAQPRGIGPSGEVPSRRVDYGIEAHLDSDWPAFVEWVQAQYSRAPLVLLGHSLGGQLSAIYAGRAGGQVAGLVLLNASFVHYRNWDLPYRPLLWCIFRCCSLLARCSGYFPGNRLGLGHRVSKGVVQDWARWGLTGRYTDTDGGDLERDLASVTAPVLSISFSDDRFYAPERAVDEFVRRVVSAVVTRWHLSPGELQRKAMGHFGHLRDGQPLWERIHIWLAGRGIEARSSDHLAACGAD
jgi:predicted alpha/beta hydrolase